MSNPHFVSTTAGGGSGPHSSLSAPLGFSGNAHSQHHHHPPNAVSTAGTFKAQVHGRQNKGWFDLPKFLVADTQLYKRLCPSVRPLVRPSVGHGLIVIELKSGKTSVL